MTRVKVLPPLVPGIVSKLVSTPGYFWASIFLIEVWTLSSTWVFRRIQTVLLPAWVASLLPRSPVVIWGSFRFRGASKLLASVSEILLCGRKVRLAPPVKSIPIFSPKRINPITPGTMISSESATK